MGERGCFSHIVGGAIKGIMIGGVVGALAGVAMQQNPQGILIMARNGAGILGPDTWPLQFPECGGLEQSPIDIRTKHLVRKKTKRPLKWTNYSKPPRAMSLENSGHSIHVTGTWKNASKIPYITDGPLRKKYYFSQYHFHWGKTSAEGSEHTVNKKSFPLEMHIVHDRSIETASNVEEENENSDELVVVAFMFEVVKQDNPDLCPIMDGLQRLESNGRNSTSVEPFAISELFDTFNSDYVCYKGSLTTPPCTEGVIWIIASAPLEISERQLQMLRNSVRNKKNRPISNHRPVQRLNGRSVYYVYC